MAELDLLGLLEGNLRVLDPGSQRRKKRVAGVVVGVVTKVDDRDGLGRVRIRFPFAGRTESAWARVAAPWAGQKRRGAYFLPEVDDEVLVAFRDGRLGHPYVIGFLWSQPSPPPEQRVAAGRSAIQSAKGHRVVIDDAAGRVTVRTNAGHKLVLDEAENAADVVLTDGSGGVTISLDGSKGVVTVSAAKHLELKADGAKVTVDAAQIALTSTGSLELEGQTVTIKGHQSVAINP